MRIPSIVKVKTFLSNPENRKKLVISLFVVLALVIGGGVLVKQLAKTRPGGNGIATKNGGNGESTATPPVTPPPSSLEVLEQSVKDYEANLEEVGKFDFELSPPNLQLQVSF